MAYHRVSTRFAQGTSMSGAWIWVHVGVFLGEGGGMWVQLMGQVQAMGQGLYLLVWRGGPGSAGLWCMLFWQQWL